MDLITWFLNAIDTIFSTMSAGSGEPVCPPGTFAAGYMWEQWRVVCLAALSVEDVEDINLFGTMITGFLLFGLGATLIYRKISPLRLPEMIDALGRAVGTQTVVLNRLIDNNKEMFTALQVKLDRIEIGRAAC